jgi:hypothetical protein
MYTCSLVHSIGAVQITARQAGEIANGGERYR